MITVINIDNDVENKDSQTINVRALVNAWKDA
jgi:hypothetical protein